MMTIFSFLLIDHAKLLSHYLKVFSFSSKQSITSPVNKQLISLYKHTNFYNKKYHGFTKMPWTKSANWVFLPTKPNQQFHASYQPNELDFTFIKSKHSNIPALPSTNSRNYIHQSLKNKRGEWKGMLTKRSKVLKILTHACVFFEEDLERLVALVRLRRRDEERFEEAVGADSDVGDDSFGLSELVHCLSHLLRRCLGRGAAGGRRRRRRSGGREWCRRGLQLLLRLLHLHLHLPVARPQRKESGFRLS